jgi:hypothetical protein
MSFETKIQFTLEFDELSDENILIAEEAIRSDKLYPIENNHMLSISCQDYYLAELGYKEMIKETTQNTSYFIFGGNACGMQAFGLYKSREGKIYIIDSWLGEIQRVFIPDKNIDCFKHIIA